MKSDDYEFAERINHELRARHAAFRILGVPEDADKKALKKAYRRASLRYHPDHNAGDTDAQKKFVLIKCAYELLAKDKPCEELLKEIKVFWDVPDGGKYALDNLWGYFLWWREKFLE